MKSGVILMNQQALTSTGNKGGAFTDNIENAKG